MTEVITLAQRRRLRCAAMAEAVVSLDAALAAYARANGGAFIRFGSSAKGRLSPHSDIDILADFPEAIAGPACSAAEALCHTLGLQPDCRPAAWCGDAYVARAGVTG